MIEIYMGKNKTGKTTILNKKAHAAKITFYEETEPQNIDYLTYLDKNRSCAMNDFMPLAFNVTIFINSFFKYLKEKNVNQTISQVVWNDFVQKVKAKYTNDVYFEVFMLNSWTVDEQGVFSVSDPLKILQHTSSASRVYTALVIMQNMFDHFLKEDKNTDIAFVLDVLDRKLHPELIYKVSKIICCLGKKVNIFLTTFSALLLKTIFFENERYNYCKIRYYYCYSRSDDGFYELNLYQILKRNNQRRINLICEVLFCNAVILVEGLNDTTFFMDIIDQHFSDNYVSIIDCGGKGEVTKVFSELEQLKLHEYIKIVKVFDDDKEGQPEKIEEREIIFYPNIEATFFTTYQHGGKTWIKTKNGQYSKTDIDFRSDFVLANSIRPGAREKYDDIIKKLTIYLNGNHH